jgi:molybdopterin converting factor small subunit
LICVHVKIGGWLKDYFNRPQEGQLIFDENLQPGTSLIKLVKILAGKNPKFAKLVFTQPASKIEGHLVFVLNGKVVSAPEVLKYQLSDGDTIMLLPVMAGG